MRRPAAPESYFEQGRLPLAVLSNLFRVAAPLYKRAPWKVAHDGQVLRLDTPQLGVEGACVSLIGMPRLNAEDLAGWFEAGPYSPKAATPIIDFATSTL
mgnify:CR=1 FL=1